MTKIGDEKMYKAKKAGVLEKHAFFRLDTVGKCLGRKRRKGLEQKFGAQKLLMGNKCGCFENSGREFYPF